MSIASILKERTCELHRRAETHPFQKALVKGDLSRGAYAAYLGQMLHVHRAMEGALDALASSDPIRAVVTREQYREANLLADLEALGASESEALAGTRALVERIESLREDGDAPALLGMHYVLEGSTNGGRFIARALTHAYGIQPGPGLSYLDPYGEEQGARWGAFRAALDESVSDDAAGDAVLRGAIAMFERVIGVLESLGAQWLDGDAPVLNAMPRTGSGATG